MFGRTQILLWVAAGLLWAAAAQADLGYLPQAGPMPLRFRTTPSPATEKTVLAEPPPAPRIMLPVVPPPLQLPVPPMPGTNAPDTNAFIPGSISNGPPVEYNARDAASETISGPAVPSPDPVVVPQMLVKYFTTGTNSSTNAAVSQPPTSIGFNPPSGSVPTPKPTAPPAPPTKPTPAPAPASPKPSSP
jgi:hypothetical protein